MKSLSRRCAESERIQRWSTPERVKSVNGWLAWFWMANYPPVLWLYVAVNNATFQKLMLLYLALVSIWANVAGHAAAWVAGRTDVKLQDDSPSP